MSAVVSRQRSPTAYLAILASLDVEHAEAYQPGHLLPGVTWCNRFLSDATALLGCPVPFMLANEQHDWLMGPLAKSLGWVVLVDESAARAAADIGQPTVVAWRNPTGHGHVGLVVPSGRMGTHVSAAGRVCYASAPLSWSFGGVSPLLFATHP